MNPNTPYNSGELHNMVEKVRTYCSKIIPLVFDNTLSYYESICAFSAKVNELCDAVNAQNLTICEFTHMVEIELEKFESYIQTKYDELRDDVNDLDARTGALETTVAVYNTRIGTLETTVADMHEQLTSMLEDITVMSGDISNLEGDVHDLQLEVNQKVDYTDVINQVLENSDKIPTSGAVYDAIAQGGGGGTFVPDATTTSKGIVQIGENINVNTGVISVPNATTGSKGAMQVGSNLNVSDGVVSVPDATLLSKGAVTVGSGLTIDQHTPGVVTLVQATENVIGGVKVGESLTMGNNGKLNVDQATTSAYGSVKIGDNLETDSNGALKVKDAEAGTVKGAVTIDSMSSNLTLLNGVLDVPTGTKNNKGVLQVGDNLSVNGGVVDVPTATTVGKGVMTIDGTNPQANPLSLTNGVLDLNIGNTLTVANGDLDVKTMSASQKGVAAPLLGGAVTVSQSGELDVQNATTLQKGVVTLGDTFGTQQTNTVPTCAGVYNNFATKSTENFAVRADAPNLDGDCQLYKIDAQGVRTNLTPVTQGGGGGTVPDATTNSKGIIQVGSNLNVASGVLSVPYADANTYGVVAKTSTVAQGGTGVPTSDAVYQAIQGATPTVPDATTSSKGIVQVGSNIDVLNGEISVPDASTSTKGVVKYGNNFNINSNGQLAVNIGENVTTDANGAIKINTADSINKGVVSIGSNIEIANGAISVPFGGSTHPTTFQTLAGVVKPATNSTIQFDANGGITCNNALPATVNSSNYGTVRIVDTIASGDTTHVPTSDAVYQAVQGAGGRYLLPTTQALWTDTADCFISSTNNPETFPSSIINVDIGSKSFRGSLNSGNEFIWIKGSLLGSYSNAITAFNNIEFNLIPITSVLPYISNLTLITIPSSNTEYLVLTMPVNKYYCTIKI